MSNVRQPILISLAAIGLVLILFWTWRARVEPVRDKQSKSIQGRQKTAEENRSPGVIPAGMQRPSVPLPSVDLPLSSTIGNLTNLAGKGDAAAACRLAAEYALCDKLRYRRAETSQWLIASQRWLQQMPDGRTKSEALSNFDREIKVRDDRDNQLLSHCRDVPIPSPIANIANWRNAALLGNEAAARQYASGNAFKWESLMLALPQLATYKLEAEQMAKQLARHGDMEITLALASGYDASPREERTLLAQTLKPDAAMSLALYRRVARKLEGDDSARLAPTRRALAAIIDELEATIGENAIRRADTIATSEFAQWAELEVERAQDGLIIPGLTRDIRVDACSR